jgi:hypothetical protein
VEFHSVADARSALRKAEVLGEQCTVSSQRFVVDFADLNAFPISDKSSLQFRDDVRTKIFRTYRDQRYYTSHELVNEELPPGYELPQIDDAPKTMAPSATTVEAPTLKKRAKESDKAAEPKVKKAKTETTLPGQFATWTRKQAELRAEEAMDLDPASTNIDARQSFLILTRMSTAGEAKSAENSTSEPPEDPQIHAICFLCATSFPQSNVIAHLTQSPLHRQRLEDTHMLDSAYTLMKSLNVSAEQTYKVPHDLITNAGESGQEYLDRAKLRREAEKQRRRELKAQAKSAPKIRMVLGGNGNNNTNNTNNADEDDHG